MATTNLKVSVDADTRAYELAMKRAQTATASALATMEKINSAQANMGKLQADAAAPWEDYDKRMQAVADNQQSILEDIGKASIVFGAASLAGLGVATKAAADWETAWTGVLKTVDGSPEQLNALEESLRGLATTLPATHQEIAGVAEAAGQLGVKTADVASFTKTMIDLGVSTNLSAEEAAASIAQLSNIMGTADSDAGRLGSALVALGNDGASTESDILAMSLRIAGAGEQIGFTEGDVLGFANALSSMGIEAEAGGTAISRVMIDIAQAVDSGGTKLENFATVAGMTGEQFKAAFQDDAAGAIASFIEGLGKVEAQGGSTFQVLDELGLSQVRVRDTLLRAANASDVLTGSLQLGNQAWSDNTALIEEANKRYATTESVVKIAGNQLTDAAIDIGATLLPVIVTLSQTLTGLIDLWTSLPGPVRAFVVVLGAVVGVAAVVGGAVLVINARLTEMSARMALAGGAAAVMRAGMSSLMSPVGLITAAIAVAAIGIGIWATKNAQAKAEVEQLTQAVEADTGAIGANTKSTVINTLEKEGLFEAGKKLGIASADIAAAALGEADAQQRLADSLKYKTVVMEYGITSYKTLTPESQALWDAVMGENGAVQDSVAAYRRKKDAMDSQTPASQDAATAARDQAVAEQAAARGITDTARSADEAQQALDALKQAFDELNGGQISLLEAQASYQGSLVNLKDQLDQTTDAARANGNALNANTVGGYQNVEATTAVANKALDAALAEYQHTAATQGADAAYAQFNTRLQASRQELFNMLAPFATSEQAAWDLVDSVLAVPEQTDIDAILHDLATKGLINVGNTVANLDGQTATVTTYYKEVRETDYVTSYSSNTDYGTNYGGGRAVGGPVESGTVYTVGEHGPELFISGEDGYIVPNTRMDTPGWSSSQAVTHNPAAAAGGWALEQWQGFADHLLEAVASKPITMRGGDVYLDRERVGRQVDAYRARAAVRRPGRPR